MWCCAFVFVLSTPVAYAIVSRTVLAWLRAAGARLRRISHFLVKPRWTAAGALIVMA